MLAPRPKDFTDSAEMRKITELRMFDSIKNGRPNTAMKPFRSILSDQEIKSVVTFIQYAFVEKRYENIRYHSPENGWYDFEEKYPEAIQYFLYAGEEGSIPEDLIIGKKIYESSCITCHLTKKRESGIIFQKEE